MGRLFAAAWLVVAACGGTQTAVTKPGAAELCPEGIGEAMPEEPPATAWWTDARTACPPDAHLEGLAPPLGDEVWCAKADGTKHGRWTWWYGEGRRISDGAYDADGAPEGLWVAWHPSGKRKMQGEYVAGKKQGRWVMWHENGEPSTDITFRDGVEDGSWAWWYESGNKAGQGEFADGKPNGRWTRCSDDGYITKVEIYDHDDLVDWIDYDHGRRVTASQ